MKNTLFLASQSPSRRMLLTQAQIPFMLLEQWANEQECDWNLPLSELVQSIARHKMEKLLMPAGIEGQECFVLTADTLTLNPMGAKLGKPASREDAVAMLKSVRNGASVGTGFCLDKKLFGNGSWQTSERIISFVQADLIFNVPDEWIDEYLNNSLALSCAGSITIESYGSRFLQSVNGSYSTIIGLPIYELQETLKKLGFFDIY